MCLTELLFVLICVVLAFSTYGTVDSLCLFSDGGGDAADRDTCYY